jgi:hypothetical protein
MRFVTLRSDATSTKMHYSCEDEFVSESVLSRSARLAEAHRVDPDGCVRIPWDTRAWRAWLTNDPSQMTADDMELMIRVIMVRSSST